MSIMRRFCSWRASRRPSIAFTSFSSRSSAAGVLSKEIHALVQLGRIEHDFFDHCEHAPLQQRALDLGVSAAVDLRVLGMQLLAKSPVPQRLTIHATNLRRLF